jgi:hypothetical protein
VNEDQRIAGRVTLLFSIANTEDQHTFLEGRRGSPLSGPPIQLPALSFCVDAALMARISPAMNAYVDGAQIVSDALATRLAELKLVREVRVHPPKVSIGGPSTIPVDLTSEGDGSIARYEIVTAAPALTIAWIHHRVCFAGRAYTFAFGDKQRFTGA